MTIPTTWQDRAQIARDLERFYREQAESVVVVRSDPWSEDYATKKRRNAEEAAAIEAEYADHLEASESDRVCDCCGEVSA